MLINHQGEIAALLTTLCWSITALAFEKASKNVGSLAVNLIRLIFAFILLGITGLFQSGQFIPMDAGATRWFWLLLSGIVGFVIGDLLLFQAFVVIGARISMLIMSLTPPITAIIGWMVLDEQMTMMNLAGMFVTIIGIFIVILSRTPERRIKVSIPITGLLLAIGGAIGQAVGLILSKKGMDNYNAFASTQIRIIAGIIGFSILFFFVKVWPQFFSAFKNKQAMLAISLGSFFGPFLGVSLSLVAIQYTTTGIASTIMATVPVFIILPAVILYKEKISFNELLGAVIAVGGVILFFI